ncbi:TMEM14 family protein [Coleofasciculus sp. G2-EDA-02]|uniref:TMEM14 family protein n=1 Tax=Coleofasciculus sp. G2-EDA-02 TaxID=3069529 RepID=UPI003304EAC2
MNNLLPIITGFVLIYALLVLVGGIIGYVKAKSQKSLISGITSGLGLLVAWWLCRVIPIMGLGLATLISLLLFIVFVIRLFRTRAFMPSGMMMVFSLMATLLFSVGLLAAEGLLQ